MHLMAFYRWCLFAESTAASSGCATTYILLHHHDGLFIINMILSISANTSSFQRRKHHHQDQHDWWHWVCNRNWESCNLYSLSSVWALPCSTLLSMKCAIYPQSIAPTQNTTIIPTVGVDCTHHPPPSHIGEETVLGGKQNICSPASSTPSNIKKTW